jgi:copper chaperone
MKSVKILIPNMQSAHCQMRVNNVLKTIEGVNIKAIEPGIASISVDNDIQESEAIRAIEKAGYSVGQVDPNSTESKCCTVSN